MIRIQRFALVFVCVLCVWRQIGAQTPKVVSLPLKDPSTAQGMEGGLWRTDHNFESTLELKNVLVNQALTATPILYMADGTAYELKPVTLEPAGVASVNIGTALTDLRANLQSHRSSYGMVGVKFNWSWPAAVLGIVRTVDETAMVSFQSSLHSDVNDAHAQTPAQDAQRAEGMWWQPYATTNGFLVLSNTLLKPTQVTIAIHDSSGKGIGQETLTLASHGSRWLALSDLVSSPLTAGSTGSVSIQYQGPANSISAFGGLEDDTNGYSATLHLDELHPDRVRDLSEHNVVLDGAGLMIGKQRPEMQFPSATSFSLYSVLHNTSSQARQVTLSLTLADSVAPETHGLGQITLAPGETRQVNYQDLFAAAKFSPPDGSVDLSVAYVGHDEDVEVEEGSVDQTGNYVFQVIPEPENWTISRTLCHWYVLRDTNTMISLWNYSALGEDLVLTLYYTGGKYLIPVHLEPRSDYELDLATLIHSGLPDSQGTVIPQSITEGSAILADAKDELNKIFVTLNAGVFNVRTATCGVTCQTCNGVQTLAITPNPVSIVEDGVIQLTGQETLNTGGIQTTYSGIWSSSNSNVSVDADGLVLGLTPGTSTIYLDEDDVPAPAGYICTGNGECPAGINLSASTAGTVNDPTPVITGITPSVWDAGTMTQGVAFSGQGFGTNAPTLSFSPSSGISYALTGYNDTQIVANITVAAGTPTEDVSVSVTSNGYNGNGFTSGGGGQSATSSPANARVQAPNNTSEITVIAWINGAAPDLNPLPSGANSTLVSQLTTNCLTVVGGWIGGFPLYVSTTADKDYANAWLIKYSANSPPPTTITPATQFSAGNYRLFNDYGSGRGALKVGATPDPCGPNALDTWFDNGQPSPYMGATGTVTSSQNIYQLAEGRAGTAGQLGSYTINGRTLPWIWSVIEFNASGNAVNLTNTNNYGMFPTYSVYVNGSLNNTINQSTVKAFMSNSASYQKTPSQIQ
jgi:hypothetical protein